MNYFVHESSFIDKPCDIGNGTKIWHFCHVSKHAMIGKNCVLGQNIFIGEGVRIGNNVKIQNNVSIYSGVEIHDDVFLGPSCVFTNINKPRSYLNQKESYVETVVEKGATIGANATILCGLTIGGYSLIGAGAVVTKNVEANEVVIGNPAKLKKGG